MAHAERTFTIPRLRAGGGMAAESCSVLACAALSVRVVQVRGFDDLRNHRGKRTELTQVGGEFCAECDYLIWTTSATIPFADINLGSRSVIRKWSGRTDSETSFERAGK
ncbi:MAG: hypothetical protein CME06_01135 [Gemmatimonadetes bacterium]|nr:hypothetical protein [Gemmatimonadota bacterium]